jgi:hypothetical protein
MDFSNFQVRKIIFYEIQNFTFQLLSCQDLYKELGCNDNFTNYDILESLNFILVHFLCCFPRVSGVFTGGDMGDRSPP